MNLPIDAWAFLCVGEEYTCSCGVAFVRPDYGTALVELEPAEEEEPKLAVGY